MDQRKLCEYCAKFDVGNPKNPQTLNNYDITLPHQPSHCALVISARKGCELCLFFAAALGKNWKDRFMSRPVIEYTSNYPSKTALNSFKFSGVPIRVFTKRGYCNPVTVLRIVRAKALKMIYSRLIQ